MARATAAKLAGLNPDGSIAWQSYTYGQLLDALRNDLQLDPSTDLAPGALAPALEATALPRAKISFNAFTIPGAGSFVNCGTLAAHGWQQGGMVLVNQGGSRGWEIKVPLTAWYRLTGLGRSDIAAGGTYAEFYPYYNGAPNATIAYSIHSVAAQPYHSHAWSVLVQLNAGDVMGAVYTDGSGGASTVTWQGLSSGIAAEIALEYAGPTATLVF